MRLFPIAASQRQVKGRRTADSKQKRQRHTGDRQRKRYVRRRIPQLSHTSSDKKLIHNIIKGAYQHRDDTRHRKLAQKSANRLCA